MATSSISADVKAANSRLAQFLASKEEEEALLLIGRKRVRDEREPKQAGGGRTKSSFGKDEMAPTRRWHAPVNFKRASPMTDRPRNDAGATSFHFSVTTVSKEGAPTVRGKPFGKTGMMARMPGADHELYVTREGAAEIQPVTHAAYIEREQAVEIDPATLDRNKDAVGEQEIGDGFDERDLAKDAQGVPSIFSNISDDPYERQEFWRAVHRSERTARVHDIVIDVSRDLAWSRNASEDDRLPADFRTELQLGLKDYEAWLVSNREEPFRPRAWTGSSESCGTVLSAATGIAPIGGAGAALKFKSGRGGTVQHRFVIELPHELTAAERAALVKRFCDHLAALEISDDGRAKGMMFTAAIHAPDAHNDARNYHLHIIAHDRPAEFYPEYGRWDFEIEEAFEHRGEIRVRYPFRQNKIGMVRRVSSKDDPSTSGRNFIPALRRTFAEMANVALAGAGVAKRYDPRSYQAMGIDRTPTEHLGTRAAALEAAGVATTIGELNAAIIWRDAQRQIDKQLAARKAAATNRVSVLKALHREASNLVGQTREGDALLDLVQRYESTARNVFDDRALIDTFHLMEAKARSRALKVRDTCLQTLVDIDNGEAPANDTRQRGLISKRYHDAVEWLASIDDALSVDRPRIQKAEASTAKREEQLVALEPQIDELVRRLRSALDGQREAEASAAQDATSRAAAANAKANDEANAQVATQAARQEREAMMQRQLEESRRNKANYQRYLAEKAEAERAQAEQAGTAPTAPTGEPGRTAATVPVAEAPSSPLAEKVVPSTDKPVTPIEEERSSAPTSAERNIDLSVIPPRGEAGSAMSTSPTPQTDAGKAPTKRTEPDEPALFDLPTQSAPVKAGSVEERSRTWDALFERIAAEKLYIVPAGDGDRLTVQGMQKDEAAALEHPDMVNRSQRRLAAMQPFQQQSVDRLRTWLLEHWFEVDKVEVTGERVSLKGAPRSVETLYAHWSRHPSLAKTLTAISGWQRDAEVVAEWIKENGKDVSKLHLTKDQAELKVDEPRLLEAFKRMQNHPLVIAALDREWERREAEEASLRKRDEQDRRKRELAASEREMASDFGMKSAPVPGYARIPLAEIESRTLRAFVSQLNQAVQPRALYEQALAVQRDKAAAEEVHRHGEALARAFKKALNTKAPVVIKERDRGR